MRSRAFVIAFGLLAPVIAVSPGLPSSGGAPGAAGGLAIAEAEASVSVLMSLDELSSLSNRVVVGVARERTSRWEELAGSRRIVTYTRVQVTRTVFGEESADIWVRTLGGVVDKIGQSVAGEAQLALGEEAFLFLADVDGVDVVTGRAQGHYRLLKKEGEAAKLAPSPDAGTLLPRQGPSISAREVLVGATLEKAVSETLAARQRTHEKKSK